MSEHTPGEWRAVMYNGTWYVEAETEVGLAPLLLAQIPGNGETCGVNARLIAAASELLAACEAQMRILDAQTNLLTCYRMGRNPTEEILDVLTDRYDVEQHAKAVIAKAKGEADDGDN